MSTPNVLRDESVLSSEPAEALMVAYERGYFEVPRAVTASELAGYVGISDNALSQRMRRGLSALVYETMIRRDHRPACRRSVRRGGTLAREFATGSVEVSDT